MVQTSLIRRPVFIPAMTLLGLFVAFYAMYPEATVSTLQGIHQQLLGALASVIALVAGICLTSSFLVLLHPLANVKIGGREAQTIVNRWQLLCISFCTTIATGILYWSAAEPFIHRQHLLKLAIPESAMPGKIIAILWHHWSVTAYSIFLVPTLLIAYLIYNKGSSCGISSFLCPIFGEDTAKKSLNLVDTLCIFSMIAGIASSLATGLMMLSGSITGLTGIRMTADHQAVLCGFIVVCFISSSISGLMRGIKWLSYINMTLVLAIGLFFIGFVDLKNFLGGFTSGLWEYSRLGAKIFVSGATLNVDEWAKSWPVFYWSSWIAWAPLTSMFLSRLTVGYRIKDVVVYILLIPSCLTMTWLALICVVSLGVDADHGYKLSQLVVTAGPAAMLDQVLGYLPMPLVTKGFILGSALICFITSADSNITVMTDLCLKKEGQGVLGLSAGIKIFLGLSIGLLAWVMISWLGVDGLRILNNLAAFPALFIVVLMIAAFFVILRSTFGSGKDFDAHLSEISRKDPASAKNS